MPPSSVEPSSSSRGARLASRNVQRSASVTQSPSVAEDTPDMKFDDALLCTPPKFKVPISSPDTQARTKRSRASASPTAVAARTPPPASTLAAAAAATVVCVSSDSESERAPRARRALGAVGGVGGEVVGGGDCDDDDRALKCGCGSLLCVSSAALCEICEVCCVHASSALQ
jgi:hypothetical protein